MRPRWGATLVLSFCHVVRIAAADGLVGGLLHELAREAPSLEEVEEALARGVEDNQSQDAVGQVSKPKAAEETPGLKGMEHWLGDIERKSKDALRQQLSPQDTTKASSIVKGLETGAEHWLGDMKGESEAALEKQLSLHNVSKGLSVADGLEHVLGHMERESQDALGQQLPLHNTANRSSVLKGVETGVEDWLGDMERESKAALGQQLSLHNTTKGSSLLKGVETASEHWLGDLGRQSQDALRQQPALPDTTRASAMGTEHWPGDPDRQSKDPLGQQVSLGHFTGSSMVAGIKHLLGDMASEAHDVATSVMKEAKAGVKKAEKEAAFLTSADSLHLQKKNELGGHSRAFNNWMLVGIVLAVALAAAAGHLMEKLLCPLDLRVQGHPRGWVLGMLAASYALLIPAIQSTLFSFNIFVRLQPRFAGSDNTKGFNITPHPVTESMTSVVELLLRSGGMTGAFFVILYAMVLPMLKLMLLVLGEVWRNSRNSHFQSISSTCILLVQVTSKWATPDLFAYILLLFLFRQLDHPPLLKSDSVLDVGFQCFSVFCLCSTFSTLAIHRPTPGTVKVGLSNVQYVLVGQDKKPSLLMQFGRDGALLATSVLMVSFIVLLIGGILTPCMGLHLDTSILLEPNGPLPRSLSWMLDDALDVLDLRPALHSEVSLWHCIQALAGYITQGEAACVMAFVMLAVFAVALTVADMMMLVLATFSIGAAGPNPAMSASHVMKHFTMLDVLCMGICVVCLAGQAYRSVGFNLELRHGLLPLVGAEAIHYLTYHLVSGAAGLAQEGL